MIVAGELPPECFMKPEPGRCRGAFFRFFYNATAQSCQQFVYGGCGGNENNFLSEKDCIERCHGEIHFLSLLQFLNSFYFLITQIYKTHTQKKRIIKTQKRPEVSRYHSIWPDMIINAIFDDIFS